MTLLDRLTYVGDEEGPSFGEKLLSINWILVLLLTLLAGVGLAMLYSAASGSFEPWASRQATTWPASCGPSPET